MKQHVSERCSGEDRSHHRLPPRLCRETRRRKSKLMMRVVASGKKQSNPPPPPLTKMTKETAAVLESNAAYYSKWDEGNSSPTFPLTDTRV